MKTKIMKKLISIACAAAMATSCAAVSVGAAPGDYDATGLNSSYYQIGNLVDYKDMFDYMFSDMHNVSPSFARDFNDNLAFMLRGRAGMFAEYQNRFRALANRAEQLLINNGTVDDFNSLADEFEQLANHFWWDLADDGRASDGFVMPGNRGKNLLMGTAVRLTMYGV